MWLRAPIKSSVCLQIWVPTSLPELCRVVVHRGIIARVVEHSGFPNIQTYVSGLLSGIRNPPVAVA